MPTIKLDPVLEALVAKKMLTDQQAEAAMQKYVPGQVDLLNIVVDAGFVKEEEFVAARAEVLGVPYVNVSRKTIPREVLNIIPESTARGHLIIAYEQSADGLQVAMADPSDRQIVEFIHKKVDMPVVVALASRSGLFNALQQYQQTLELELQGVLQQAGQIVSAETDLTKVAEDLPVIRITDIILKHAILEGASDIHLEPTEKNVVVRFRLDGLLHDVLVLPHAILAGLIARIKILSRLKIDEHRLPQDGRFKIENEEYNVAFRVSILPVFDGEKVVMRLLDESGHGLGLDSIGLRPKVLERLRHNISKPHGMILVTGPTGSGKTTTLYAALKELNQPDVNISTVEDPIEYRMPRVNQTQINPKIGLTFSNGLRSLVRQDPDIIMVGEIRDEETASLAVNAALTGHLVLSTLHTNSAAGALPRLLDMKVEAFLVATTTNILMAQRLVRRLCQECKKSTTLTPDIIKDLSRSLDVEVIRVVMEREGVIEPKTPWDKIPIYQAVGCRLCKEGYKGRTGIYELLEMTDSIRKMVTASITSQDLADAARKEQEMITMLEDGFMKAIQGQTTLEEVLRVSTE